MKKTNEIVQRIQSHYVGDDCIQIMFPYQDTLTILNPDGMLYHHKQGSNVYVNKYLEDERRKQFPYSNIPTHFSKVMFKTIAYTNQLLDFEKPYIRIGDGYYSESFVIKDNNQALLISSIMKPDNHVEHMTYDELLKYVGKHDNDEQIYYVDISGGMPSNNKQLLSIVMFNLSLITFALFSPILEKQMLALGMLLRYLSIQINLSWSAWSLGVALITYTLTFSLVANSLTNSMYL